MIRSPGFAWVFKLVDHALPSLLILGMIAALAGTGCQREKVTSGENQAKRGLTWNLKTEQKGFIETYDNGYRTELDELRKCLAERKRFSDELQRPGLAPSVASDLAAARATKFIHADQLMKRCLAQVDFQRKRVAESQDLLDRYLQASDPADKPFFDNHAKMKELLEGLVKRSIALQVAWDRYKITETWTE